MDAQSRPKKTSSYTPHVLYFPKMTPRQLKAGWSNGHLYKVLARFCVNILSLLRWTTNEKSAFDRIATKNPFDLGEVGPKKTAPKNGKIYCDGSKLELKASRVHFVRRPIWSKYSSQPTYLASKASGKQLVMIFGIRASDYWLNWKELCLGRITLTLCVTKCYISWMTTINFSKKTKLVINLRLLCKFLKMHFLNKNTNDQAFHNTGELRTFTEREFYIIPNEYIKSLFESIRKRNGSPIKY